MVGLNNAEKKKKALTSIFLHKTLFKVYGFALFFPPHKVSFINKRKSNAKYKILGKCLINYW